MHDLIRDMGREIVRAESLVELGKRSRLWHSEDAKSVLMNESGTEAVEGLNLRLPEDSDDEESFSTEAFKKMRCLKFLRLENVKSFPMKFSLRLKLLYLILTKSASTAYSLEEFSPSRVLHHNG
ncbi:hypothetical protein EV2_045970 [Malus domestica]